MGFPKHDYDPRTLALMRSAFDASWEEIEYALAGSKLNLTELRTTMVARILLAVNDGERDPDALAAGLDDEDSLIIRAILAGLDNPAAPPGTAP